MMKVKYVSGCMARTFTSTDGSNKEIVPAYGVAPGAIGYCLVFDNISDAVEYSGDAEVEPFVIDEADS